MSKIRPYTQNEAGCFIGEVAQMKGTSSQFMVTGITKNGVFIGFKFFEFSSFLRLWTWFDGSVCGIEEEEI